MLVLNLSFLMQLDRYGRRLTQRSRPRLFLNAIQYPRSIELNVGTASVTTS